jgi:hypothetical protein
VPSHDEESREQRRRQGVKQGQTFAVAFGMLALGAAVPAQAFEDAVYKGRFAAQYFEAGQLRTISVLPFAGPDGENFAKALAGEMRAVQLNEDQWYTVKAPDGIDKAQALAVATSGDNTSGAVAIGKKLDVKGIYTGTVQQARISRTDRNEVTTECADGTDCKKKEPRNIVCTRIVLEYAVAARIINVASGATIYAKNHAAQDGYDLCNGKGQEIKVEENEGLAVKFAKAITGGPKKEGFAVEFTEDALFQRVRANIAGKIRADVAPSNRPLSVEFKRRASELPKPQQVTFESGTPFIKADRLDRACSIWEVMESDPAAATSISLLYNLGVCQEALVPENPSAALEYYVKADQLTIKPDKLVSAALLRAKEMVENQKKIGS